MPERTQCKKNPKSQFDPEIGKAASAQTALAERTQAWTEDFYDKHLTPLLETLSKTTAEDSARQGQIADAQLEQMRLATDRYKSEGIPAEDRYYKMVDQYSAPEEEERQAQSAIGDQRVAAEQTRQSMLRRLAGTGLNPGGPAAVSAMSDMAVQEAAAEAAAATRARSAAKALGMSLTADAANFGRGGGSQIAQFASGASGASATGARDVGGAVSTTAGAAAPEQGAFGIAQRAYGSNLDAYASLRNADVQAKAQSQAGIGQVIGMLGSAYLGA
jgi:hypothetical protein